MSELYGTTKVTWGKDASRELSVRGLSTQDLTLVIKTHKDSLTKLFEAAEGRLENNEDLTGFGMELMDEFPDLVALLIALAADMPDKSGEVLRLPAPIQLRLMQAVYELTIEDTGGIEDFLQNVFALLKKVRGMTHSLNSLQPTQVANTGT